MKPKAVGFVDKQLSGAQGYHHEIKIRDTAKNWHLDLARTMTPGPEVDDPIKRLLTMIGRLGASTVIAPRLTHFGGYEDSVIACATVIEAETGTVWRRGEFGFGAQP
ncbi:hypothetical protein CRH09_18115 [Nocardia terpenica]|uniref:Uncharacterized protein n=1 Tax=Nocardia terpenica TaxID=455432 RepID=A0A291RKX0_9NOCA|nr:hypothetical protein CRH09_18115 [Nocardia terpenica]